MVENKIQAFKLTKQEWEEIEIEGNENERKVSLCMLNLGSSKKISAIKTNMTVLGEEIYQEYMHSVVLKTFCNNEKSKKTAKKEKKDGEKKGGGKKKGKNDIYSKHIAAEKYKKFKDLANDLPKWNMESLFQQKNNGFNSNILEIKLLSFLQVHRIQADEIYNNYELIIALKKCLYYYSSYEGMIENDQVPAPISETCIELLNEFLERTEKKINFSVKNIFSDYPKLIFSTKYDDYFESLDIKPFDNQIEIINFFKTSLYSKSSTIFFYRPVIGSGKTTVCLAMVASILEYNKKTEKDFGLIFCCGITQVRIQLGQMIYTSLRHQKISFAIAAIHKDEVKIVNHFSCKNEKKPVLIIADLETTNRILKETPNSENLPNRPYILFIDDPIIDADQESSPITEKFIEIMQDAPPLTIISSATLPMPEDVPNLIRMFRNKHPLAKVVTISSDRAKIGQQIYVDFKNKYYPHLDCPNKASLKNIIKKVKASPFLARMYTGSSLFYLDALFFKITKTEPKTSKIENYFTNPTMYNQKSIEDFALSVLESLMDYSDEIVKEFCLSSNYPIDSDYSDISFQELPKKDACKLSGGCLITSLSPKDFARKWFGSWVEKCDLEEMNKEYQRKIKEFEEGKKKFDDIKNEIERFKELESYQNMGRIKFKFPDNLKINTKTHLERYGKESLAMVCRKDEEAQNLVIQDLEEDINLMLMSGIAIFDELSIDVPEYHKIIRRKAKANQIAYLISKTDILYGANFPLNNIIIEENFSNEFSINTIFQIMGRAGRMGTSWKSNCFIFQDLKKKLENHLKMEEKENFDSNKESNKIEKIVKDLIEVDKRLTKNPIKRIIILYRKEKVDSVFAFLPCFWYYCLKLKKQINSFILSDFDISQYIHTPFYNPGKRISYIPEVSETIIVFDGNKNNIMEFVKEHQNSFKKLIIIHHQTNLNELIDYQQSLEPSLKKKIKIISNLNDSAAKLSFDYYISRIKEDFGLDKIEQTIPDLVKVFSKKAFNLLQYAEFVKYISDYYINFGKNLAESKWVVSIISENLKRNEASFNCINLKKIWNLMTMNLEESKLEGKKIYQRILEAFLPLIRDNLKTMEILNEKNEKASVFCYNNIPFNHSMHSEIMADLIFSKFESIKMKLKDLKKVVAITKQKKNSNMKVSIISADPDFDASKFCEYYQGVGSAYTAFCELSLEKFEQWTFVPIENIF